MVDGKSIIVTFPCISRTEIWLRSNTFQYSLFGHPGKCISNKWATMQLCKNVDFWQEFLALQRKQPNAATNYQDTRNKGLLMELKIAM